MFIKIAVFIGAIIQVIGAISLSIGTFENTDRVFTVFIQPASWAFSIWGLIYLLSFIYAVYQLTPQYDNETLRRTRVPALIAFFGSTLWLYFAGQTGMLVWLTVPTLFVIALALTRVIFTAPAKSERATLLSKHILYPYAAWTGIACWVNIQALLVEQSIVANSEINILMNAVLFIAAAVYAVYFFYRSHYSLWYGGVVVWASTAIISAHYASPAGIWFAVGAGALISIVILLYLCGQKTSKNTIKPV